MQQVKIVLCGQDKLHTQLPFITCLVTQFLLDNRMSHNTYTLYEAKHAVVKYICTCLTTSKNSPTFDEHQGDGICSRNYHCESNSVISVSLMNNLSSSKGAIDNAPCLRCAEHLACETVNPLKATFYCKQCNSLQCTLCEDEIHRNSDKENHERFSVDSSDDEYCSVDKCHPATVYCSICTSLFCHSCYEDEHQHSDGREHKAQKYKEGQILNVKKNIM